MQTSLLGLAIAFIIALVAALVGPLFMDWNQFRSQFETEASRALGAPVHVNGTLDARLLPTPTLRLRAVSVGGPSGVMSADKLDVEFSLGSLLRGEWRANELSLDGFALDMGLDKDGQIEGPLSERLNVGSLTIDRFNLNGRAKLHDASSGKTLELDDLKFSGDVRTIAGTLRGEGSFKLFGARTPFRISTGQSGDGKGMRLRFITGPGDQAVLADFDGVLTLDGKSPKFEGATTLAYPADAKDTKAGLPWRVSSKLKANTSSASFEQIETSYGPDDNALKLNGVGDIRFGADPLLRLALSARQLDADRVFNKGGEQLGVVKSLRRAFAAIPAMPFLSQLDIAVDQVTFGGRPVQNVSIEVRGGADNWTVGKFELRAPGVTHVSASGTIAGTGDNSTFTGPVTIESGEPDALAAWLEKRNEISYRQKPIKLRGLATISPNRMGLDSLRMDSESEIIGRMLLEIFADDKTRFEADLKSNVFNFDSTDSILGFVRQRIAWPDEAKISVEIAKAVVGGHIRPVTFDLAFSPTVIALNRLTIGDAGNVLVNGTGSLDRRASKGSFALTTNAASLDRIGNLILPFAPSLAGRLNAIGSTPGATKMQVGINFDTPQSQSRANFRADVDIDAPPFKGVVTATASPATDAVRGMDWAALARSEMNVETKFSSAGTQSMLTLLGLSDVLSAQNGAAQFESSVRGAWGAPLQGTAKLSGAGVDGDVQGKIDLSAETKTADLSLTIRKADMSAWLALKPASIASVALSSRLKIAGDVFTFDDADAMLGGSRVRGKMTYTRGNVATIDGELKIDTLDVASSLALAFGAAGRDTSEPFGRVLLRNVKGQVAFQALSAVMPGNLELRSFGGVLKGDGQSLALDGKGNVGDGTITANASARQTADGTSFNARMTIADAEGPLLTYRGLAMPVGKMSGQLALTSQGRSAAALSNALSGAGSVTMKNVQIAKIDPLAFDAAVRVSDEGKAVDAESLKAVVDPVLLAGTLALPSAQIPFSIKDGRLRVAPVAIEAARSRIAISGGYDLVADQADIKVVLSANVIKPETGRPDIRIDWVGPPDRMARTLDLASLSSWLAMRSIDRETRKLDQLERGVVPESERELQPVAFDSNLQDVAPLPRSDVKIPARDPRRRDANPKSSGQVQKTTVPPLNTEPQIQPLPPPITILPAPGGARLQKQQRVTAPQSP